MNTVRLPRMPVGNVVRRFIPYRHRHKLSVRTKLGHFFPAFQTQPSSARLGWTTSLQASNRVHHFDSYLPLKIISSSSIRPNSSEVAGWAGIACGCLPAFLPAASKTDTGIGIALVKPGLSPDLVLPSSSCSTALAVLASDGRTGSRLPGQYPWGGAWPKVPILCCPG